MNDIRPPQLSPEPPRPRAPGSPQPLKAPEHMEQPTIGSMSTLDLPPVAPTQASQQLPKRKRHILRWIIIIFTGLVVAAGIATTVAYFWYQEALRPVSSSDTTVKITVDSGEESESIAKRLEEKSVIKSALAFNLFTRFNNKHQLKAGTYLFAPNQTVAEIVAWLEEGKVYTEKITIIPGKTLAEIKEELEKHGYKPEDIAAAFAKDYDHPLLKEKPKDSNLEGYLYPDTYFVGADTTVEQLLGHIFDVFEEQLVKNNLREALKARGFTLHEGIILASLIDGEVPDSKDRHQVAQVFEKRLGIDMPLGSDVSFKYAAKLLGIEPSPTIDSPYNTRLYKGYPPGPVGAFTIDSLQAVAQPAEGNYLYFVSGDDGKTYFSDTFEQHEKYIQEHCQKLCFGE